uniref:Uncharacterized protein n=1 Tax=Myotis myotis TaxID=51298 RepID=A0A7J7SBL5_MYOMY|nr:hypothetical protein mMyoMyo1_009447 [Myotis myotis]
MSFMLLVGKSLHNWTDLCRFLCIHTFGKTMPHWAILMTRAHFAAEILQVRRKKPLQMALIPGEALTPCLPQTSKVQGPKSSLTLSSIPWAQQAAKTPCLSILFLQAPQKPLPGCSSASTRCLLCGHFFPIAVSGLQVLGHWQVDILRLYGAWRKS